VRALAAEWSELASGASVRLVGPGLQPVNLATSQNVSWHTAPDLPGRWRNRPASRLWSNTVFMAIAAAERPDVLFFPWSILPRVLIAPAVVTVHDVCFRTHPDRFGDGGRSGDAVLAHAVRAASEILTPSFASKRGVVASYALDERYVTVVHHGIAPVFTPTPASSDQPTLRSLGITRPYILCVSTHEPRKNLDVLVQAFACSLERSPESQLVFVGRRSPHTPALLSAAERTLFVEGLSDLQLAALYRHTSAVAVPSVCEGFGFPLLEAIACGAPVLASDLSVFRELVDDAAVYLPAQDMRAWADALDRVLTDQPAKARALDAAARVRRQFAWRSAALETLRVLERAAARRRKLHWKQPA
jgi:glycosyltransferase involved in cell wall biosynthesis